MKKLSKPAMIFALCALSITQTGCFGEFALTRKLYNWNDGLSDSKFVKSIVFWVLSIIPVYGVAAMLDVVIFNLIEFWGGSNPLSMNEGDHEIQMATIKGIDYKMEATKDTFTTTQLSGDKAGEVRVMKFDRSSKTWKYTDSRVCDLPVLTILDDKAENIRLYTGNGTMDMATADLPQSELLMARLGAATYEPTACAN